MSDQGSDGASRADGRVPFYCKVTLKFRDVDQFVERYAGNISESGLFIQSRNPQPEGSIITITLQLKTGDHLFMATALVKWVRTPEEAEEGAVPGMGLQFLDVHPRDREWLNGIVARNEGADDIEVEVSDPLAGERFEVDEPDEDDGDLEMAVEDGVGQAGPAGEADEATPEPAGEAEAAGEGAEPEATPSAGEPEEGSEAIPSAGEPVEESEAIPSAGEPVEESEAIPSAGEPVEESEGLGDQWFREEEQAPAAAPDSAAPDSAAPDSAAPDSETLDAETIPSTGEPVGAPEDELLIEQPVRASELPEAGGEADAGPAEAPPADDGDVVFDLPVEVHSEDALPEAQVVAPEGGEAPAAAEPVDEALPLAEAEPVDEALPLAEAEPVDEALPIEEAVPIEEAAPQLEGAPPPDASGPPADLMIEDMPPDDAEAEAESAIEVGEDDIEEVAEADQADITPSDAVGEDDLDLMIDASLLEEKAAEEGIGTATTGELDAGGGEMPVPEAAPTAAPDEAPEAEAAAAEAPAAESRPEPMPLPESAMEPVVPEAAGSAEIPKPIEEEYTEEAPAIGIDLGTTYSCSSVVQDGKVKIVPTPQGKNTIPSVVAWENDRIVVGEPAQRQRITNPSGTVYGFKRLIGRKFGSPFVEEVQRHVSYQIVPTATHDTAVILGGQTYSLQQVSGAVLGEIKRLASAHMKKRVQRSVITVPAYYNENQRKAVRQAGQAAGLTVTRIVNEPTAAAMAYGFNRNRDTRLLVYDLGGGTFDASVVHVQGNVFEVAATGGETFLGGMDFDNRLVTLIWEKFKEQESVDLPDDPMVLQRIIEAAEEAKRALSTQDTVRVELPYIAVIDRKPRDLNIEITRAELEDAVIDLVKRTLAVCDRVLASANLTAADINAVLLTGGQSRMPRIHQVITEHFGRPPLKGVHPDEAVAIGAALLADSEGRASTVELVDVLPQTIGVGLPGGRFMPIILAQTRLPHVARYKLGTTRDNQKALEVHLFQGESDKVAENELLGSVIITNIPKGPKGSRRFEIAIGLNRECLLTVTVRDERTGRRAVVRLSTKYTPQEAVKRLGGKVTAGGGRTELDVGGGSAVSKVASLFSRILGRS